MKLALARQRNQPLLIFFTMPLHNLLAFSYMMVSLKLSNTASCENNLICVFYGYIIC